MPVGHAAVAMSWFLIAGVGASAVLALLRRWSLVVRVARVTALLGGCVLVALFALIALLSVTPGAMAGLLPEEVEPSQKARALAETISMVMNCGAVALLAGGIAAVFWVFASRRARTTRAATPGP